MTTWRERISNLPIVLNTILKQSIPADKIVVNLSYDEIIPEDIKLFLVNNNIEINRVADTKVYKKLIPTLKRYPNDCIITIDDDWIYPKGMIEDFIRIHKKYPDNPISGNHIIKHQLQCHCGCASLVKASYFGTYLNCIDEDVIKKCPSDDMVYTYFTNKAGFPYIRTENQYFTNMEPYNDTKSYTESYVVRSGIDSSFEYLVERFGKLSPCISSYLNIKDDYIATIINEIFEREYDRGAKDMERIFLSTYSYRLGDFILKPMKLIKSIIYHKIHHYKSYK